MAPSQPWSPLRRRRSQPARAWRALLSVAVVATATVHCCSGFLGSTLGRAPPRRVLPSDAEPFGSRVRLASRGGEAPDVDGRSARHPQVSFDELEVGQAVKVRATSVDVERGNLAVSMRWQCSELEVGQKHTGIVRAIEGYGAYVDVGAERDGLLHVSKVAEERVDDIHDYLKVGQKVQVWVSQLEGDGRFEVTMVQSKLPFKLEVGQKLTGTVRSLLDHLAYVDIGAKRDGVLAIGRVAEERIDNIHDYLKVGQEVQVWVSSVHHDGTFEVTMIEMKPPLQLEVGQKLTGTVASLRDYGAFVDVGAQRPGLLHVSGVADRRIADIHDYLKVGQEVQVWVAKVHDDGRSALTMIEAKVPRGAKPPPKLEVGQKLTGTVAVLHDYGAFVDIGAQRQGLLGIGNVAEEHVDDIHDYLKVGQEVQAWVSRVKDDGKIQLSMIESHVPAKFEVGQKLTGTVASLHDYGAFVKLGARQLGLVKICEVVKEHIDDIHDYLAVGQEVQVWVTEVQDDGKIWLTMIEGNVPAKLEVGQKLTGAVTSLHDYGAFVSVGARQLGLLDMSAVAEERVDDINDYLKVGQEVQVWVSSVRNDGKFRLTMLEPAKLEVGQKLTGAVISLHDYGAFVDIGAQRPGLLGIGKVAEERVDDIHDYLKVGQEVQAWVSQVMDDGKIELTMVESKIRRSKMADLSAFVGVSPDLWLDASVVRLTPSGALVSVSPPGGGAAQESYVKASYIMGGSVQGVGERDASRSAADAEPVETE